MAAALVALARRVPCDVVARRTDRSRARPERLVALHDGEFNGIVGLNTYVSFRRTVSDVEGDGECARFFACCRGKPRQK